MNDNPHKCIVDGCSGFNYVEIRGVWVEEEISSYMVMQHPWGKKEREDKCTNRECVMNNPMVTS